MNNKYALSIFKKLTDRTIYGNMEIKQSFRHNN